RRTGTYLWRVILAAALFALLFVFLASQDIASRREEGLKHEVQNARLQLQHLNKDVEESEAVLASIADRDNNIYRLYFEANPIPDEQRKAGFGGINRYKDLEGFDNSKLIIESHKRIDQLQKQIVVQSKSLDEIAKLATDKEKLLEAIPAIQ